MYETFYAIFLLLILGCDPENKRLWKSPRNSNRSATKRSMLSGTLWFRVRSPLNPRFRDYRWGSVKRLFICLPFFVVPLRTQAVLADNCGDAFETIALERFVDQRQTRHEKPESQLPNLGSITRFDHYQNQLHSVRDGLKQNKTNPLQYHSVFYPLMGTDVSLPLILFPNVKTIVTLDGNPFLKSEQVKDGSLLDIKAPLGGPWRKGTHIESEGVIAPRLLGALFEAFPRVKILDLKVNASSANVAFDSEIGRRKPSPVSAILSFDLQDGQGARRLIYLNETVSRNYSPEIQRVLNEVWNYKPEVSIFKASMGIAKGNAYATLGEFGKTVLEKMKNERGLIIEGTASELATRGGSGESYLPEFTHYFKVEQLPNLHDGGRSYLIPNIPFGYNVGVLATDFSNSEPE